MEQTFLEKTKKAKITNISSFGFWLHSNDKEYFVSYKDYPALTAPRF